MLLEETARSDEAPKRIVIGEFGRAIGPLLCRRKVLERREGIGRVRSTGVAGAVGVVMTRESVV